MRLGDLGARVIKIERPDGGDLCRRLYLSDTEIGGDSTLFHAINRGKESFAADFKDPADVEAVKGLIARADVVIQNFRPGVIERLGLDYRSAKEINPGIVYASITGYGEDGPWAMLPGQDLLAQARSGVMWLNGDATRGRCLSASRSPICWPAAPIVQGVLAALVRRGRTGKGAHIETSLLEALVDFQFEVLTTYLNDGGRQPARSKFRNAHAYLAAPYGVYPTSDGWLALAMTPLDKLASPRNAGARGAAAERRFRTARRDQARDRRPRGAPTDRRLARSTAAGRHLVRRGARLAGAVCERGLPAAGHAADRRAPGGRPVRTTRSPIRVDGRREHCRSAAPRIGEHTAPLRAEFGI